MVEFGIDFVQISLTQLLSGTKSIEKERSKGIAHNPIIWRNWRNQ
jgi:hypothetical protein